MAVLAAYVVPHPPMIIPQIGGGREQEITRTIDSYRRVARDIGALAPDVIVLFTPHATMYADYIHIAPGPGAEGDFSGFGYPGRIETAYDTELVRVLEERCRGSGFSAGTLGEKSPDLDHGTLVPLHFLREHTDAPLVRISASGLTRQDHYGFGLLLRDSLEQLDRRAVLIASGDLSHRLTADGPYGYVPEGPQLDEAVTGLLEQGDFGRLLQLPVTLCQRGAACGLDPIAMMAGVLDQLAVDAELYSYEGPFGVGYAVAAFAVKGRDPSRNFLQQAMEGFARQLGQLRDRESPPVRLARYALESYVRLGKMPGLPDDLRLPEEFLEQRAGVFVSIKRRGELRGCIGTIGPTEPNIAREIMQNAVSAGVRDPRFSPVDAAELSQLVYSVDLLRPPETVRGLADLDPERYGVIVSSGVRRGLLLPGLEGVDTPEDQVQIACEKAAINPDEHFALQRFEVVRYL